MKDKLNFTLVGLFVLVLGIALIAGVLWLAAGGPKPAYKLYLTYMTDSVYGLSKDSAVTYHGVDVGRVRLGSYEC
jgi:phospholipid/cholesterol/gamma-HCH transport system substrate-binding protein